MNKIEIVLLLQCITGLMALMDKENVPDEAIQQWLKTSDFIAKQTIDILKAGTNVKHI